MINDQGLQHPQSPPAFVETERFDLHKTVHMLFSGWITIAAFTALCFLLAIIYLHVAEPAYTAMIVLSPTQSQGQNVDGTISGLASLAGINIGRGQSTSPFLLFPYAVNSRAVAEDIVQHSPEIMPIIYRSQWDASTNRWREPPGYLPWIETIAKIVLGFPANDWTPPDAGALQQYIKKNVSVEISVQKPVLTITFQHKNQAFSAHFLQMLYESTDRVLRRIVLDRSSKYARYVEDKLQTVQLAELRQVLMQSLNEQETLVMMSSSSTPFSAQPLGPAFSSIRPTSPNAPVILLLAVILGLALGSAAVLVNVDVLRYFGSRAFREKSARLSVASDKQI